jgi:hypothetical protein
MVSAEGENGVTALSETPEVSTVKGANGGDDLNVLVLRCDVCVYSVCVCARESSTVGGVRMYACYGISILRSSIFFCDCACASVDLSRRAH